MAITRISSGLLVISVVLLNCGSGSMLMVPPEGNMNLLIGSVVFENKGFKSRNEVFVDRIEVAVMGYYEENGKEKLFGKWVVTDENGYFFVPNVPDGNYAVKGLRVDIKTDYLTIANSFRSEVSNYQRQASQDIAFSGTHFETLQKDRIVNLRHNYFTLYQDGEIRHGRYHRIDQFKASSGEVTERPFIHEYFIEKYPESGWEEYLKEALRQFK